MFRERVTLCVLCGLFGWSLYGTQRSTLLSRWLTRTLQNTSAAAYATAYASFAKKKF